jgi:hypothetical protein
MVENIKNFYLKFISGRLGLAVTFWLGGVLVALALNFLISHATTLSQIVILSIATFTHFVLISIAVWNASKLYLGSKLWKWFARLAVVFTIARWLWYLPLLVVTLSGALGFPIISNDYWELNASKFVCQPAEYLNTPEMLVKKDHCATSANSSGELIAVRCQDAGNIRNFIFTKNEQNCLKYLAKLESFRKNNN